ncbi:MAG: hypothetical protein HYY98_05920 [Burkholderiales bacterium]|nr:hypothetical protein [Burkholderiales bacterium]
MKTETAALASALDVLAREIQSGDGVANAAIAEAAQRLRELQRQTLQPIDTLPNNGVRVLLLKRTGQDTVMSAIGYRDAAGNVRGWIGKRLPTHWIPAPAASARFS